MPDAVTVAITMAAYHAATMASTVPPSRLHLAFQGLRLRLRGSDLWFIALALLVGLIAGGLTLLQSDIARAAECAVRAGTRHAPQPVSYTHLTLPTICSV
mgnify:CR=1 FL=1